MERLTIAAGNGVASVLLEAPKVAQFPHDALIELGFDFMGFCWGSSNKPYHEIDTELGIVCVVNNKDVYLIKGNREHRMRKIKTMEQLKQFINLLDIS